MELLFEVHFLFLRFRLPFILNLRESKMNNSTGFNGKQNQLEEDKVI